MIYGTRQGYGTILTTFVIALILLILPLPESVQFLRPDWIALVLIYWCTTSPRRVGIGTGWTLGLLIDTLKGSLLGQHALGLSIVAFLSLKLHERMRLYPVWQQTLTILMLLTLYQLINLWILGVTGQPPRTWDYWMPSFTGMLLWPIIYVLLQKIRLRRRIQ